MTGVPLTDTGKNASLVHVSGLRFGYERPGFGAQILKGVSLDVGPGTLAAVVGPNGSGKSTLLKAVSGFLHPQEGRVLIGGSSVHRVTAGKRSSLVTYCGDEPEPAFEFSVEEVVLMGRFAGHPREDEAARLRDPRHRGGHGDSRQAAERAMKEMDVFALKNRPVTRLSSGERQRVYLARAVYQDPDVLLLDEPTAHLDMAYELKVMDAVRDLAETRGKAVLAVLHDLNLALRYGSVVFFLKDGRLAFSGPPERVTENVIESVYGVKVRILRDESFGYPVVIPLSPASPHPGGGATHFRTP